MTTKQEFAKKLKGHDWYHRYSDDSRYYRAGVAERRELNSLRDELNCPFDMDELFKWSHNMIVEQFAEETPGEWFRQPRKFKCVAPCSRFELITQSEWDAIMNWLDN